MANWGPRVKNKIYSKKDSEIITDSSWERKTCKDEEKTEYGSIWVDKSENNVTKVL